MMTKRISGAKGGETAHTPVESPDNLRSIAYFRILDLVSEGEIGGLVNGQQSIYLDETPLANPDGTSNFPKAHISANTGTPDQSVIPGFDSTENEISVNVELKSASPWLRSITNPALSAIRLTLGVPALSKANTTTGDITGYTINYRIELQTDGGAFQLVQDGNFTGKTTTKYQRSLRIDLPHATTGWQIRVTRLTANANSSAIQDTTTIDSYTEIVDSALAYPNSALVGCMGDASQFSNIPQRAYDLYGRIIQVPSNYDVTTRTYSGTWDGTFKPSWSDNPAWVFYDICTNTRYGLGHLITAAQVDKWELYKIGQYCDELVDDGHGGQEPRFACNIYLQTQADAYKLLNDLSTVFRGISYWANGTIVASADMPADPVYTYTDANVINGQFSYSASARKTRYSSALISWNDPRNFYRTKIEYVEDAEGIARYGFQQATATAVGCTSQGQAQRFGKWLLLTSRLETDTVTFSVGLDGTIAAPGQIIRVADSARAGKRQGGRVSAATTTVVTVDVAPTVAVGDSLTVIMPDGISQTRTVSAVSGNTITVSTAFTSAPLSESVWTAESATLAAQTYRVLAVTEDKSDKDISFTITALQHNASKFDAVDTGTAIVVPPISALTTGVQSSPLAVTLSAHAVVGQVATYSVLTIAWEAAPGATRYTVEWRRDDGEWLPVGNPYGLSVDVVGISAGTYTARVRAVSSDGNASLPRESDALVVADASALPTSIGDIQGQAADAQAAADAANLAIANIASDGVLAAGEKPPVIRDYSVITTEQAGIDAQATAYGITTEKTTYDGKVTALTTYLGTLGGTTAWNDLSGNTTIDGPTFRAKFADVYTSRQALLNAIYAAAKSKADTAKAAADAAQAAADKAGSAVPVINPRFVSDTSGWTFDNPAGFYREAGSSSPDSACGTYLVRQGQSGGATTYARDLGYVSVVPGQTIIVTACLKSISANAGAYAGARISWRDATHAEVAVSLASVTIGPGGTYLQAVSKAAGQAPSTAQFAHFELYYVSHSSGFITATSCGMTVQPASIDEVPDGGAYGRTRLSGLINGTVPLAGAGKSLLANPTFTRNAMGIPVGFTAVTPNDYLKDNWKVIALANPQLAQISEASDILLSTATGVAIANGAQVIATVVSEQFPLSANQTLVGELISGFANIGGPPVGISCLLRPFIRFVNASGGVIGSYQMPDIGRGGGTSRGAGLSPSGTASAYLEVNHYLVNTSGSTYVTGSSIADFRLTSFNAYSVSNIDDEVRDGTTYGRTSQSDLYVSGGVNRVGLRVAGSGQQVGDQRNLVSSLTRNLGITRSAVALTANAGGSVDINAHTIQMGAASVSYAAKTNAVTGLATSSSYYIYTRDNYAGGSPTWFSGTNQNVVNSYDDAYNAGVVTIPTSGTSGGGAGGGGIDQCVAADMYLRRGLTARQLAERWRWWRPYILHGQDGWHFVRQRPRIVPQLCCRITVADGSTVDCSLSTPVTVRTGDSILAPMVYGHDLWTDSGWQRVINVELLNGERDVVHISTGGHSFLAGTIAHLRISTHNLLKN